MTIVHLRTASSIRAALSPYHPIIVEGHGPDRDKRDPRIVANRVASNIRHHWRRGGRMDDGGGGGGERLVDKKKPPLLIIQGDPYYAECGISAITRYVSEILGAERCLVCLDERLDPEHAPLADRYNVKYELYYSSLLYFLGGTGGEGEEEMEKEEDEEEGATMTRNHHHHHHRHHHTHEGEGYTVVGRLENAIDDGIVSRNARRNALGMDDLANDYRRYAMLQEVTKAAMKVVSGEITIAHTTDDIDEFSVTSFYEVGLELGLIDRDNDMVRYSS